MVCFYFNLPWTQGQTVFAEESQGKGTPNGTSCRIFERVTECFLAAVGVQPEACASYVPHFLPLYADVLLSLSSPQVTSMRAKSRSFLVKFLARVMCCHVYKQQQWDWEDRLGKLPILPKCWNPALPVSNTVLR